VRFNSPMDTLTFITKISNSFKTAFTVTFIAPKKLDDLFFIKKIV
jgi:hypothetical protein